MNDVERVWSRLTLAEKCEVTRSLKSELSELFRAAVPDRAEEMILDRLDGPEAELATARRLVDEIKLLQQLFSKNHWEALVKRQEEDRRRREKYAREAAARLRM
jgi:hypothetical protein